MNIIDVLPRRKVFRGGHPSVLLNCFKQPGEDLSSDKYSPSEPRAGNIDEKCFSKVKSNEETTRQSQIEGQSTGRESSEMSVA